MLPFDYNRKETETQSEVIHNYKLCPIHTAKIGNRILKPKWGRRFAKIIKQSFFTLLYF